MHARYLARHRRLAIWLIAAALLLRVLVPAGFMIGDVGGAVTIELCTGHGPMKMTIPSPGKTDDRQPHDDRTASPCAFSGIAAPALAGADPILLVAAIAFVVATVFRVPELLGNSAPTFLRPPPRGPPAIL